MAVYPVKHVETGETKEVTMSVHDWDQWKKDNAEWIRDWSDPSTCPSPGETGEWRDKLVNKHPAWNEVLSKAQKAPGSRVKKL